MRRWYLDRNGGKADIGQGYEERISDGGPICP